MVMFGVTGDLSRKKLMPAIYDLANRGLLPPGFSLVGFARRDWADEDFGQVVYQSVRQYARGPRSARTCGATSRGFPVRAGHASTTALPSTCWPTRCTPWSTSAAPAATSRSTCPSRPARSPLVCEQLEALRAD
jgi:hypothetical protein